MKSDHDRLLLEIRSLKLGIVLAGALVALAISAASASRDLAGLMMFVSGTVVFVSVIGLLQLHFRRRTMEALREENNERA